MQNARLVVPAPSDVEIESWDARPQRPKLDLDGQNLLKLLRYERYAEAVVIPEAVSARTYLLIGLLRREVILIVDICLIII